MDGIKEAVLDQLSVLWSEASKVWLSGGWGMVGIAVIALVMFGVGTNMHFRLRAKGFRSVPERLWRTWIEHPAQRKGPIGNLLDRVTPGKSLEETLRLLQHLRATETLHFERDLRVMRVCVGAAPLVGLLGTVTGMLATFGALSTGSGGEKTMGRVAAGISQALITTETGLVVALPGLFFLYQLVRKHERYKAFLAHLESVYMQMLFQRTRRERLGLARSAAKHEIAKRILQRVRPTVESRASGRNGKLEAPELVGATH